MVESTGGDAELVAVAPSRATRAKPRGGSAFFFFFFFQDPTKALTISLSPDKMVKSREICEKRAIPHRHPGLIFGVISTALKILFFYTITEYQRPQSHLNL